MRGFKTRWGKRLAAITVGAATVVTMGVMSAQSASAYYYSYGHPSNVYVTGVTPVTATPGSTFSTYPTNNYRAITSPSMYIYKNGVYANQAQMVIVTQRLWKYSTYGWQQTETITDSRVIPAGATYIYHQPSRQFFTQLPNAWYTVRTQITLYSANASTWLYTATIEPNSPSDFACASVACYRASNSVYVY